MVGISVRFLCLAGLGNIMDAMKKAQEFTSVAKDLQEQLRGTVIEASVRGGQVTVTMTGQQVPLNVVVTDELIAKGSEEVCIYISVFLSRCLFALLRHMCSDKDLSRKCQ